MRPQATRPFVRLAPRRKRIGMLTPSSNTVLEPVTSALMAGVAGASVHYARLPVTRITLEEDAGAQFALEPMLAAARLLADALVDVIVWNGTSGSWLGLERDRDICDSIRQATGIPATTSSLALLDAYEALGIRRVGLVTPYTDDVNEAIAAQYASFGLACPARHGCGLHVNEQFACVAADTVEALIRHAAHDTEVDAVAVVCTNMDGAALAAAIEAELGKPVLDSVAVTAWQALRMAGVPQPALAERWGGIFKIG
ncbi:aspartate/glutamate racemase family protein [Cohnella sp. GCM10012308]|uniref:maleate cis-trans isomerase family protein n=1 Tax=Cohnella sp. GCM10012308 TaxID=3317329 RepID=UPI0036139908